MDADAGGLLDNAGADLEQVLCEGCELGPGERHPAGHGIAQGEHQPVGRGVQEEMRGAGRGKELEELVREARHFQKELLGNSSE